MREGGRGGGDISTQHPSTALFLYSTLLTSFPHSRLLSSLPPPSFVTCPPAPLPPTFLPSISPQQITICLQPLRRTPQLFWLQLQIYLYQTMQKGLASLLSRRLGSPSVHPTVRLPELHAR